MNKQANAVAPILSQALAKRRQLSVDSPVEAIIRPYAHPVRVARSSGPDTRDLEVLRSLLLAASLLFYGFYHWPSVFLLLFTIGFNYSMGRAQMRVRSKWFVIATPTKQPPTLVLDNSRLA